MNGHTSSAEPQKLFRYAIRALKIDGELVIAANRLAAIIAEFQTTCIEPMLRPPAMDPLLRELQALARLAQETDRWIYQVGREFATADQNAVLPSPPAETARLAPVAADNAGHALPVTSAAPPLAVPLPTPAPVHVSATPAERSFFSQQAPAGDAQVLDTVRFEQSGHFEIGQISGHAIHTVRDHIREYGCLMTNQAMLLNDMGEPVTVTDLYKANFAIQTGHSFEQAASAGAITLPDLNTHHQAVAVATAGRYQLAYGVLQGDPNLALTHTVATQGSVILQTAVNGNEHWIIIDHVNRDGSYAVRDPWRGLRDGIHITLDGSGDYQFNLSGAYQYLLKLG